MARQEGTIAPIPSRRLTSERLTDPVTVSCVKESAGFRVWEVEGVGVGSAEVRVEGPVPGLGLVGSDLVEIDPERFGFSDQVERVVDLFAVEPLDCASVSIGRLFVLR